MEINIKYLFQVTQRTYLLFSRELKQVIKMAIDENKFLICIYDKEGNRQFIERSR